MIKAVKLVSTMSAKTEVKKVENRIAEVLENIGIQDLKPTPDQLERIKIPSVITWNKIIEKKANPTFEQIYLIAEWLKVPVQAFFPN